MKSRLVVVVALWVLCRVILHPGNAEAQDFWRGSGLQGKSVRSLAKVGNDLLVGTAATSTPWQDSLYRSTDNGASWMPLSFIPPDGPIRAITVVGTNIFCGDHAGVFRSTDNGSNWMKVLPDSTIHLGWLGVAAFASRGGSLYVGGASGWGFAGVYRSIDSGASWTSYNAGLYADSTVSALSTCGTNLFAGTYYGVFRSTNEGAAWIPANAGIENVWVMSLAVIGTNIFAGTRDSGIYRSTDYGASWTSCNNGFQYIFDSGLSYTYMPVWCLAAMGNNLIASSVGVFLSTDNGANWASVSAGLPTEQGFYHAVYCLTPIDTDMFAGSNGGLCRNSRIISPYSVAQLDSGWNLVSTQFVVPSNLTSSLFPASTSSAFGYQGRYYSTDSMICGQGYWLKYPSPKAIWIPGGPIMAETVTVTQRWNLIGSISIPIASSSITSIPPGMITSDLFYFGGSQYNVADTIYPGRAYWVRVKQTGRLIMSAPGFANTPAENRVIITSTAELPPPPPGVEMSSTIAVPMFYALEQNFPNPFNPMTEITYSLTEDVFVSLIVYDVLGREVRTLVNEHQVAGFRAARFDASQLPSGVYIYRIQAGTFLDAKKMLLVR